MPSTRRLLGRLLAGLLLATLLALVFLAYTDPELMRQLSEQLWACF